MNTYDIQDADLFTLKLHGLVLHFSPLRNGLPALVENEDNIIQVGDRVRYKDVLYDITALELCRWGVAGRMAAGSRHIALKITPCSE
jgi:hypothetical protein